MAERDEQGRFAKGYSGGPGRPRKVVERAYLDEILDVVTLEKWRKVINKALTDAIKGSPDARRWLADYIIGKPPQILELRAAEAALLRELLNRFEAEGISASALFNAMLTQLATEDIDHDES